MLPVIHWVCLFYLSQTGKVWFILFQLAYIYSITFNSRFRNNWSGILSWNYRQLCRSGNSICCSSVLSILFAETNSKSDWNRNPKSSQLLVQAYRMGYICAIVGSRLYLCCYLESYSKSIRLIFLDIPWPYIIRLKRK